MTATDAQVRIIMRERSKGHTQEQAAVKANLSSCKTVRKYERLGQVARSAAVSNPSSAHTARAGRLPSIMLSHRP